MKPMTFILPWISFVMIASMSVISSCSKDDFTIENKAVTGDLTFIRTAFIPLSFDSTGLVPLSAQISMEGDGTLSAIGDVHFETTFKIDLVLGMGTDFVTTYTGSSPADSFSSTGTSQVQPNGSFLVQDNLGSGTGKFSKISGEGTTTVWLNQAQDAGTVTMDWNVTF